MPCATVHLLVARETLKVWEGAKTRPFELTSGTRAAFIHGSLAPDVGFIPGVDRFVSELAHYHRPADLCRALLNLSATEEDVAFSWGWLAHVLGDVALHPMVGRAVGEQVHGDRSRRMNAAEHLPAHVAMEVGLDIVLLTRHDDIPPPPTSPYFDADSIGLMRAGLEQAYGLQWSNEQLLHDHRTAVSRTRPWPLALRTLRGLSKGWRRPMVAPIGAVALSPLRWLSGSQSAISGFLQPRRPPDWLVGSIERGAVRLSQALEQLNRTGLDQLENRNLETGEIQPESGDLHPGAVLVREKLKTAGSLERLTTGPGRHHDGATVVAGAETGRGVGSA